MRQWIFSRAFLGALLCLWLANAASAQTIASNSANILSTSAAFAYTNLAVTPYGYVNSSFQLITENPPLNPNGTVTLWASTSTVSGSGDQGADPNKLVEITDNLKATTASQVTHEQFSTAMQATYGQVVRGVAFTPGTPLTDGNTTSPRPSHPQGAHQGPLADREQS